VSAGVVDLGISGGEPMLRKDLPAIIGHAKKRGMTVGVGSNGTTLVPKTAQRLRALGLDRYQVSLDGSRAQHDALRRWPGLFDKAVLSIGIAREHDLRVHVCMTVHRLNVDELEALAEHVAALGVHRLNISRFVPTGRGTEALDLPDAAWRGVIQRCVELRDRMRGRLEVVSHLALQILADPEIAEMPSFVGCQAGIGQGCVTANGTVYPCVLLPIPVGNVRRAAFETIWRRSPVIQALQRRDSLEGACSHCAVRSRCGGCRAVAFAKTGNYLATDGRCWLPSEASLALEPKGA